MELLRRPIKKQRLNGDQSFRLHEACKNKRTSMKVLRDTYYAFPEAAYTVNSFGSTPLHIAIESSFEEAVEFLTRVCPETTLIHDKLYQLLPIRLAVEYTKPVSIVKNILEVSPKSAFVVDSQGESAFSQFCKFRNSFLRVFLIDYPEVDASEASSTRIYMDNMIGIGEWCWCKWSFLDLCRIMEYFLKAGDLVHSNQKALSKNWMVLHSALKHDSCPMAFCMLFLMLHPDQAMKKDNDGNLPMHIVTALTESTDENTFICTNCFKIDNSLVHVVADDGFISNCCRHCYAEESEVIMSYSINPAKKISNMVTKLLNIAPQMASIPDAKGRYPLHIAVQNQQSYSIIQQLFIAHPIVIKMRDVNTQLLPFMLASVGTWKNENEQINVIFMLLEEDPLSIVSV